MICSSIHSTFDTDLYPRIIREAVSFFRDAGIGNMAPGEYEIDGRNIYYQVIDMTTKNIEDGRPEVHRKYIDIQFLFDGKESIGFVDDYGNNQVDQNLLEERDLLFYKDVSDMTMIAMKPGDFCVFFPNDVHMPGCMREANMSIRKVVYKVNYDFYKNSK
ncbi:MAG: YhcH/YjgK/YiaL family protein [Firmicutes bacterium HGW-Firmicutes-3]|jgi:YhcH/YjgK/YiaL family protein|nr:MAG: YhcH/YjgK/YiaL family protein [Firmicutes bacterium HGW-Firmicutes-3]